MHKPNKKNLQSPQKSVDWLKYIDDCQPGLVIPIGRRFQAEVPEWTGPSNEGYPGGDFDNLRWLGTKTWPRPLEDNSTVPDGGKIGKGRPDSCSCASPGSSVCVERHISEARTRLRSELGPAYNSWKFDEMGQDIAKSWTSNQKKKFDLLVRTNPLSQGKSFLKPAVSSFTSKTREDIVSYYLNVYVPKRISMITRSGHKVLVSDDDEVEEPRSSKNSLKRSRPTSVDSTNLVKSHYLTGRR